MGTALFATCTGARCFEAMLLTWLVGSTASLAQPDDAEVMTQLGMKNCAQGELVFNGSPGSFVRANAMDGERNGFYFTGRFRTRRETGLLLFQRGEVVQENPQAHESAFLSLEIVGGRLRASRGCAGTSTAYVHAPDWISDGKVHSFRLEESSTLGLRMQVDSTSFVSADHSSDSKVSCTGIIWGTLHIAGRPSEHMVPTSAMWENSGHPDQAGSNYFIGTLGHFRVRLFWFGQTPKRVNFAQLAIGNPEVKLAAHCTPPSIVSGLATHPQQSAASVQSPAAPTSCTAGVVYGVIDHQAMPLQKVWQAYFDACPYDSYRVVAHTTARNEWESGATFMREASFVAGANLTRKEDTRFKFGMVKAMYQILQLVDKMTIGPDGCRPQWIHFLSESCVPLTSCSQVHSYLQRQPPTSFIDFRPAPPHHDLHPIGRMRCKSSQWITMHSVDISLFAAELYNVDFWETFRYAPDEFYFCTELRVRQRRIRSRVLLYVDMPPPPNPGGHARWLELPEIKRLTSKVCLNEPFGRKMDGYRNVSYADVSEIMQNPKPICNVRDWSDDRRVYDNK